MSVLELYPESGDEENVKLKLGVCSIRTFRRCPDAGPELAARYF